MLQSFDILKQENYLMKFSGLKLLIEKDTITIQSLNTLLGWTVFPQLREIKIILPEWRNTLPFTFHQGINFLVKKSEVTEYN